MSPLLRYILSTGPVLFVEELKSLWSRGDREHVSVSLTVVATVILVQFYIPSQ